MTNVNVYDIRLVKEKGGRYNVEKYINKPEDVQQYAINVLELDERTEEVMGMLIVNAKNRVLGVFIVSIGSLSSSIVHPREVFKRAIIKNASGIVLFHNHPSGNPEPSRDDIEITKRIVDGGKILGISVFDHIIIGENNKYVSLKEKGEM